MISEVIARIRRRLNPVGYARSIGVKVGEDCRLIGVTFSTEPYLVTLGDHVSATRTHFETHDGGVWVIRNKNPQLDMVKPIRVGDNVYFGAGCLVLPGVTIGNDVVVGACSVVTKDIPDNSVAVGVPARVIKTVAEYGASASASGDHTKHLSAAEKRRFYIKKYLTTDSPPDAESSD